MKWLLKDLSLTASLAALHADPAYPVSNLQSPYLRRKFQSTATSDTLTFTWGSAQSVSSVFLDYTNATSATVRLYSGPALLTTLSGLGPHHFTAQTVTSAQVDLVATDSVYLGGAGFGTPLQIDPPESFWDETFDDRSLVSESQAGQVLQEYVRPLRVYTFNIPTLDRDEARTLENYYLDYGIGALGWLDPETDDLPALYCTLTAALTVNKNKRRYAAKLNFREAR